MDPRRVVSSTARPVVLIASLAPALAAFVPERAPGPTVASRELGDPRAAIGYGVSPYGATRPAPPVRVSAPRVSGALAPDAVRRVVMRNARQISRCYERALARSPDLQGRIVVHFVIAGQGLVTSAIITEDSVPNPALRQCVTNAVRAWRFPATEGGEAVTVDYPFVLQRP